MNAKTPPAATAGHHPRQQRGAPDYTFIEQHPEVKRLRGYERPAGVGFQIRKIGHVVLHCRDIERSVRFYTEVLGFQVSDVYPQEMAPGSMVFLRCGTDHHGIGLVGGQDTDAPARDLNHLAFEVGSLDEVLLAAKRLRRSGAVIDAPLISVARMREGRIAWAWGSFDLDEGERMVQAVARGARVTI